METKENYFLKVKSQINLEN